MVQNVFFYSFFHKLKKAWAVAETSNDPSQPHLFQCSKTQRAYTGVSSRINVEIFTRYLKGREISKLANIPELIQTEKVDGNNL